MDPIKHVSNTGKINRQAFEQALRHYGLDLTITQIDQLWRFHQHLRQRNPELNLTRIHNFDNMVRKHYVDSCIIDRILRSEGIFLPSPLLDLGSGAGFPGIPLAILRPDVQIILAEGRQNRAEFLTECADLLGLRNAVIHGHRISSRSELTLQPQGVISRAVEDMGATLRRVFDWLPDGGRVIFMKGPECDDEIQNIQADAHWNTRWNVICDAAYTLPHSADHRRLVVWQKQAVTADQEIIRSTDNSRFKLLRGLRQTRNIKKQSVTLVAGDRIVPEWMRIAPDRCEALIYPDTYLRSADASERRITLPENSVPRWTLQRDLFREVDPIGTNGPLLLFRWPEIPSWNPEEQQNEITLLLPLSNPENLGAALRNAAAFGVERVVLLAEAAHPFHPISIRSAAGHQLGLSLFRGPSIRELNSVPGISGKLLALSQVQGTPLEEFDFKTQRDWMVLVGEEGRGVPQELNIPGLRIAHTSGVESLNASVALGI
ncbi:MAG: 16S rRNA (guanine(527)-N(7))-methyltransferase RsmG, partial [Leptospiraceae bacterium]|nr:16S rRNA (guanine(527)-N(7))-methyltransferase RsmG [Leptospiraceae bacterium]